LNSTAIFTLCTTFRHYTVLYAFVLCGRTAQLEPRPPHCRGF